MKLHEFAKQVGMVAAPGEARLAWDKRDQWQCEANDWRITLKYKGRRYSFDFWQGTSIKTAPTREGVLECLQSDAQVETGSFEDFCANTCYDPDSRKAERIYKACVRTDKNLRRLFGTKDYSVFMAAEL